MRAGSRFASQSTEPVASRLIATGYPDPYLSNLFTSSGDTGHATLRAILRAFHIFAPNGQVPDPSVHLARNLSVILLEAPPHGSHGRALDDMIGRPENQSAFLEGFKCGQALGCPERRREREANDNRQVETDTPRDPDLVSPPQPCQNDASADLPILHASRSLPSMACFHVSASLCDRSHLRPVITSVNHFSHRQILGHVGYAMSPFRAGSAFCTFMRHRHRDSASPPWSLFER